MKLDPEEKALLAEAFLEAGKGDDQTLLAYIRHRLGYRIPSVAVCPGHCAPADYVTDSYFGRAGNTILLADRGGGKTLDLALLEHCELRFLGLSLGHVAATLNQSGKFSKYLRESFKGQDRHLKADVARHTELRNGGELDILTGTVSGVNAPHPVRTSFDEFELAPWEVLQEAFSMPQSHGQHRAAMRLTSTWKFTSGNVTKMLDEKETRGYRCYIWCVWETVQQCHKPDCKACQDIISYDRLGKKHTFAERCQGKARRSRGFKTLEDAQNAFKQLDYETWLSQWECLHPESVGQYYQHYMPAVHEIGPGLWKPHQGGHYRTWDFGVADPNSILFVQWAGKETLVVVDMIEDGDGDTPAMTAPRVIELSKKYGPLIMETGDPAGANKSPVGKGTSAITDLANTFGLDIIPTPKQYEPFPVRHKLVEDRLRIHSDGKPRLYIYMGTVGGRAFARHIASVRRPIKDGQPYGEEPIKNEHYHSCSALERLLIMVDIMGWKPGT